MKVGMNMENEKQNTYWNEIAEAKLAADIADIADIREMPARKAGPRRSRIQKHKDSIRVGKQRREAALYRYKENKVPNEGKLRHHQLSRDQGSDNIHNIRAVMAAEDKLANFGCIEVEVFEPATA